MRRSNVPAYPASPTSPASPGRSRWRALLAAAVVALFAGAGIATAAPAAAEDVVPVDDSTLEITITDCDTYGGDGELQYLVRDPFPAYRDFITVTDAAEQVVHSATYLDGTEFEAEVALDPGDYTILYTVERETGGLFIDEQAFTIGACPDVGVSVTALSCSTDRDGVALATFTGLIPGFSYGYSVVGPDFLVGGPLDEVGETEEIELVGMPPGNYYATIEWIPFEGQVPPAPVFDWVGFSVDPCQPTIQVEVTQCTAAGGTGSAAVTLGSLVNGVEYAVWITDAGAAGGEPFGDPQLVTGDQTGTGTLTFGSLPDGHDYTVLVEGVWEAGPWEEPPFVGSGGNFVPLESVVLAASVDFSLQACPAASVKPASTTTLPPTGPDGVGAALLVAVALLGLGGASLLATRRHTTGARDLT